MTRIKLSPKMIEELEWAAREGTDNRYGMLIMCNKRTEDALIKRGLVTYDYKLNNAPYDTHPYSPVITVAGWEYLKSRGIDRPADYGRYTFDEAWNEARLQRGDAAVIGEDDMRDVARRIRNRKEEAVTDSKITPEVIEALRTLRMYPEANPKMPGVGWAIEILDNAGVFAAIDEATGYDVDPEPEQTLTRVSKCTCPGSDLYESTAQHLAGCPGDPEEWGDMAYSYAVKG